MLGDPLHQGHIGTTNGSTAKFNFEADNRHLKVRGILVDVAQKRATCHLLHDHEQLGSATLYSEWALNQPLGDDTLNLASRKEDLGLENR